MRLTARQVNRASLGRQLLLRRRLLGVVEAVHRLVALQAQEAAPPYLALWNRLVAFDPVDLDRAFADHGVVKATLMRIAMHAVDTTDYPAFRSIPRGHRRRRSARNSRLGTVAYKQHRCGLSRPTALAPRAVENHGWPIQLLLPNAEGDRHAPPVGLTNLSVPCRR